MSPSLLIGGQTKNIINSVTIVELIKGGLPLNLETIEIFMFLPNKKTSVHKFIKIKNQGNPTLSYKLVKIELILNLFTSSRTNCFVNGHDSFTIYQ